MTENKSDDLSEKIGANLPYLRRYARALTGSQERGDQYAMATLEAVLSDRDVFDTSISPKTALFKVFQPIWASSGAVFSDDDTGLQAKAQAHLAKLTTNTREALLLHTIEEFSFSEVGIIMDVSEDEARSLVDIAYDEMSSVLSGRVMIIEDEAIIAMDLEGIVSDMGHRVTGIARTESDALKLFNDETPDLILSDIQLADGSSGIDAVNRIMENAPEIPVIFITAFPERLLTGEGPEPAFLIPKPYQSDQVRSAVSQAMFFSSTETLKA
ncbi:two-component response regulator [Roseovarius atlanticus]|uniref:Two-component response regulator n=1 Tax=Roseovarius atlanticus TaxID=1641875 RepID=A0A0T5NVA3_9RHOB|nr:response regulator [Roseovarius atlanticus]KRS12748.1 two-component response regulator [Roseovarius atlanticus]